MAKLNRKSLALVVVAVACLVLMIVVVTLTRGGDSADTIEPEITSPPSSSVEAKETPQEVTQEKSRERRLEDFLIAAFSVKKKDVPADVIERAEQAGATTGSSAASLAAILLCENDCVETSEVSVSSIAVDEKSRLYVAEVSFMTEGLGALSFNCFVTASSSEPDTKWGAMECFAFEKVGPGGSDQ